MIDAYATAGGQQAAGHAFWARQQAAWEQRRQRGLELDPPTSQQTAKAQYAAILEWRQIRGERFAELKAIKQPTLVVNGSNDIMVPTVNSWIMSQRIPNAQLIVYPDAGHAALPVSRTVSTAQQAVPGGARHSGTAHPSRITTVIQKGVAAWLSRQIKGADEVRDLHVRQ
jgi:homoserine acetyltransferase